MSVAASQKTNGVIVSVEFRNLFLGLGLKPGDRVRVVGFNFGLSLFDLTSKQKAEIFVVGCSSSPSKPAL